MSLVDRQLAYRILGIEALAVFVGTLLVLWQGVPEARSFAAGGIISLVGHAYFAFKVFAHGGAQATRLILRGFYVGEAGKFMITVMLFAAVFKGLDDLRPGYLMAGFFLALVVNRLAPWWARTDVQRTKV